MIKRVLLFAAIFSAHTLFADTWSTTTAAGNPIRTSTSTTKVGIGITGTNTVRNMLDVEGAAVIGAAYSGSNTAPANGLLVEGSMAIGRTAPGSGVKLDVNGKILGTSFQGDGNLLTNVTPIGSISVWQHGARPNNLSVDYTSHFQAALNAAGNASGGIVYIPPGQYTILGTLIVPRGVTLQGSWTGPHDAQLDRGTTLRASSGQGGTAGDPFITLREDGAVKGITIFYPAQSNPNSIIQFPWTISATFDGDVENVTLANSFLGIRATENSHLIRNVNMTAFSRGVSIDNCLDISRLENVHIHPKTWFTAMGWAYTSDSTTGVPTGRLWDVTSYTIRNLIGFSFGTTDWQEVNGCFVIWSLVGMQFNPGSVTPGSPNVQVVNSGVDVSQNSIQINASEQWTGINFLNCNFVGANVIASSAGPIKFTNCGFHPANRPENPNQTTALIYSNSTATISLTSCLFWNWDIPGIGHACITMNQGVAFLSQCEFKPNPGKRHFNLYNTAEVRGVNTLIGHTLLWGKTGTGNNKVALTNSVCMDSTDPACLP